MSEIKVVNVLGADGKVLRKRYQHFYLKDGRTKPSLADVCDINKVIARVKAAGRNPMTLTGPNSIEQYRDISRFGTLQEAYARVRRAEQLLASLPSKAREAFGNDPQRIVEAIFDESQRDKLVELGVLTRKPGAAPTNVGGSAPADKPPVPPVIPPA